MPAAIPDRYQLDLRLGRDGDIEEWLATDTSLDRPVLIRSLGPEAGEERKEQFVATVSSAAKAHHPHLSKVFVVEEVKGGAYAVSEWTGGATMADRVNAESGIEMEEFLPNATGLAGALAALHETGVTHGSIDLSAITYSEAHPAKLGAFGRPFTGDKESDVRALAAALESALTGEPPGGPPPSESIDGISPMIDRILHAGQNGSYTASEFEKALSAAPTPRRPRPEPASTSRRLLYSALGLVLLAIALVGLGALFGTPANPIVPTPTTVPGDSATVTRGTITPTTGSGGLQVVSIAAHDPFGEGGENDSLIPNLIDGSLTTTWQTERYQDRLPLIKPGVGVVVSVEGTPQQVHLAGFSQGTVFEIRWSPTLVEDPEDWVRAAAGTAPAGTTSVDLPPRVDGFWLLWMIDLPLQGDGTYYAQLSQLRLEP
ncbi:MAG: protein kinase [Acidimicrobiia bacterium]